MTALSQLLGERPPIAAIREQIGRLLRAASGPGRRLPPILILGETGTGKGLLAATIHRASGRAAAPFVDVNCAAIPETLMEAELFGFERGAFTDARQAKPGLFQAANGGAIFLDEVGLMPLSLQAKLLKVLEERSVRRLGSVRAEPLDVCLVAATSEDLPALVKAGRFRPDLYHRLAVVTLQLPPLRARGRDVLLLAEHVLAHVCHDYGLPPIALTKDAEDALLAYDWPGNVRELGNVLERAALLAEEPRLTPARLGVPRNTLRYRLERPGLAPEGPAARRRGGRPPSTPRVGRGPDDPIPVEAASSSAGSTAREPSSPPEDSRAPRQEARRVTLMQVRLIAAASGPDATEIGRTLEATADKIEGFGGRIEERSAGGSLAAFGLTPEEDAPRRAAHAALAVQRLAARARIDLSRRPDVAIALHTQSLRLKIWGAPGAPQPPQRSGGPGGAGPPLDQPRGSRASGQLDGAIEIEAETLAPTCLMLEALLDAAGPGAVVASAEAARFLVTRFDLSPLARTGDATAGACRVVKHADLGRTRFVGRERELALLTERFELARAGRGQVVLSSWSGARPSGLTWWCWRTCTGAIPPPRTGWCAWPTALPPSGPCSS